MDAEASVGVPGVATDDRTRSDSDVPVTASHIAVELEPLAGPLDRQPERLAGSYDTFRRFDYLASPAPSQLGGGGAGLADIVRAQRTIAASCSNSALAVNMHLFQIGALADRWRVDGSGERLLRSVIDDGIVLASTTGEAITLDSFATPTTASPTRSGYRIDGRKHFCSQALVMDRVRVLATDVVNGDLLLFVVPADARGLMVIEPPITMGMRGTQSFDLALDGVDVDCEAIALRCAGHVPLAEPAIAAGAVWFLFLLAGVYAGVADGARIEAIRVRRAGRPSVHRIERLHHRIDALLEHGLRRYADQPDLDFSLGLAAATKDDVLSTANELVDECVNVVGAVAYSTGSRLEQSVRDVRAGRHHPPDATTTSRLLTSPDFQGLRARDTRERRGTAARINNQPTPQNIRRHPMTLQINDAAPDFTADTTAGPISFHDWLGDSWGLLFSHPKDFTPVCATELGAAAAVHDDFVARDCKLIGISVDPVDNHLEWLTDIERATGHRVDYPLIGDPNLEVAKLYGMLPADAGDTSEGRTAADNATTRSVFVIGPDKSIKAVLTYPMTTGRNFAEILRVLDSCQLTAREQLATPANWQAGDRVIVVPSVSDEAADAKYPGGVDAVLPYLRYVDAPVGA